MADRRVKVGRAGRHGRRLRRWTGPVVAVCLAVLSLSGMALVWPDAIDRIVHPARFGTGGGMALAPEAYLDAARQRLGGDNRVAALVLPGGGGPVMVVAAGAGTASRPGPSRVYLDPVTARVLDVAIDGEGTAGFLRRVHRDLLMPGIGGHVAGAIGVAAVVWAAIGLWSRRRPGLALALLPAGLLTVTGTWLAFARPAEPPADIAPLARTGQPVATIMARAQSVAPGAVRRIDWPGRHRPDWTVTLSDGAVVKVADDTGTASAAVTRGTTGRDGLIRRLHGGAGMGTAWRIALVIAGLVPVGFAILAGRRALATKKAKLS